MGKSFRNPRRNNGNDKGREMTNNIVYKKNIVKLGIIVSSKKNSGCICLDWE